jgi:predicted PurR-regulated permease PerM
VLDATLVGPKIHGTIMRLPTLVIIISMLLGFELMGFWGALLAPPVAAAIRLVLRDFLGREPDPGLPRMT